MFRWRSFLYLLPQIWRALVRRPQTVRYPFGPMELPPGFRGRVIIDADKCRGCGICVMDCPANGLELFKEERGKFRLIYHPDRCAYCGQCELSCNFDVIRLSNDFVRGTADRETLTTTLVDRSGEDET